MNSNSILGLIAASLLAVSAATPAQVISSGHGASEVEGIVVSGNTYDVTFGMTPDLTFLGDSVDATTAANELKSALNGSGVFFVFNVPSGTPFEAFEVQTSSTAGIEVGVPGGAGTPWINEGACTGGVQSCGHGIAEFNEVAPASVPEPDTLALLGLGLAVGGFMRRRKIP